MVKRSGVLSWEDLLHIAIIKVHELNDEKFNQLHEKKQLSFYMYGILWRQNITPHLEFHKQNEFIGSELIDDISGQADETEHPQYTYDQFAKYCLVKSESDKSEDVKLAAKVTYGYLIYEPSDSGKKSYRSFQLETGIHYSSTCQYVKKMKELYITDNHDEDLPSITQSK